MAIGILYIKLLILAWPMLDLCMLGLSLGIVGGALYFKLFLLGLGLGLALALDSGHPYYAM